MLLLLLSWRLFELRSLDQCSFFACALLYPGPISTFHSRSVHSLRSMAAFEAADWGWCWGARFVRRPLARCAVSTFRVCVLPFQFVDHCELLLCMYIGNPLFNLQLEPYRRLSCFCIIFLFAHSINTCLQRAHISQTAGQFHRANFPPPISINFFY